MWTAGIRAEINYAIGRRMAVMKGQVAFSSCCGREFGFGLLSSLVYTLDSHVISLQVHTWNQIIGVVETVSEGSRSRLVNSLRPVNCRTLGVVEIRRNSDDSIAKQVIRRSDSYASLTTYCSAVSRNLSRTIKGSGPKDIVQEWEGRLR